MIAPSTTPATTECWLVGRQWSSLRSRLEFSEAVSELSLRVLELPTSGDRAVEVLLLAARLGAQMTITDAWVWPDIDTKRWAESMHVDMKRCWMSMHAG